MSAHLTQSGGGNLSAALDDSDTRRRLALAVRHEITIKRFAEEPERVLLCLLCAGLDRGLNAATFPTQRELATVARMSETKVKDALLWLASREIIKIGKKSPDAVAPAEPDLYFVLPPPYKLIPIRRRFLPPSEDELKVWRDILNPGSVQFDWYPNPYGLTEAIQDSFDSRAVSHPTARSAGVAPPPSNQVRAEGAELVPTVSVGRPNAADAEFTQSVEATPVRETAPEFAPTGDTTTSPETPRGPTHRLPGERFEDWLARVESRYKLAPGASTTTEPPPSGTSPRGKFCQITTPERDVLTPGASMQISPQNQADDELAPGGSPRARPRIASLAQIDLKTKLAKATEEAIAVMKRIAPGEYARFSEDGWRQAAEKNPKRLLSVLAYVEEEMIAREEQFARGEIAADKLIHNPLSWGRQRAIQIGLLKRSSARRAR